jgi:hypothetical protein
LVAVAQPSSPIWACSIWSNDIHGNSGLRGCLSFFATSSSTSGVARDWCNGFMAGPASVASATPAPDSGRASVHDSRTEWSGRIRSARALVSSMKLPKLTTNGTLSTASRTRQPGGVAKTGLTSSTSNTWTGGFSAARISAATVRSGRLAAAEPAPPAVSACGMNDRPPGASTAPSRALSALTANA